MSSSPADMVPGPIAPHGGRLIERCASPEDAARYKREVENRPHLRVDRRVISDIELLATGGFSPLDGFMVEEDYRSVLSDMRLASGLVWSLPITLPVSRTAAAGLRPGDLVGLESEAGEMIAALEVRQCYAYDRAAEAQAVYGTMDRSHPGVDALFRQEELYLGGPVTLLSKPPAEFAEFHRTPRQTRELFAARKWRRVVAFQTRNPVHRAHEYIQKCALETVDGLLLHPLVGETKGDDVPASVRMACYQALLERYYPPDRTVLSVFPANMRYAGPREAIFHALVRKNYGCTHFIVGRDHAGVGSFYGPLDAQHIFDRFRPEELSVTPLFFDHTFFCRTCEGMASAKSCPHGSEHHVTLSGTKVREMLRQGLRPPKEFTRPEVAEILVGAMRQAPRRES